MKIYPYTVLLYYHYVPIADAEVFREEQRSLCESLGMTGRILVADEGINGTAEGTAEAVKAYMEHMHADPRFADMVFKTSAGDGKAFKKLIIKTRPEIITTRWGADIDVEQEHGEYLEPEELHQWFTEDRDDFVIVDVRNNYEIAVGKFERTVHADTKRFFELEDKLEMLESLKDSDKKLVAVCNGNIRCEKATALLKRHGFENVYHLHHGIHTYMEKFPGEHFKGTLCVFDDRLTMQFAGPEKRSIISRCYGCNKPTESLRDCSRLDCPNNLITVCETCMWEPVYCSDTCRLHCETATMDHT